MLQQTSLSVTLKKTKSEITPRAGLILIEKAARELGLEQLLTYHLGHLKIRQRGLPVSRQIMDIASMLIDGANRIEDIRQLNKDKGWQDIRGGVGPMAPRTARDLLYKFGTRELLLFEEIENRITQRLLAKAGGNNIATIDADATFIEADKIEANMSYHKKKGYYPMLGFCAENGITIQGEFRQGNESPHVRALSFLKKCERAVSGNTKRIRVRADAAWFQSNVMDYCEKKKYEFAIGGHRNEAMMKCIDMIKKGEWEKWTEDPEVLKEHPIQKDWEIAETVYSFDKSNTSYRVVVIRKPYWQLDMFKGMVFDYDIIITNMNWEKRRLVKWYWERCNSENWIKELKYGFGLDQFPCSEYLPNGAYFHIVLLAYNLVQGLKLMKLGFDWMYLTVKTLRYHLFHVAGLVVNHARQLFLKLFYKYPHYDLFHRILYEPA